MLDSASLRGTINLMLDSLLSYKCLISCKEDPEQIRMVGPHCPQNGDKVQFQFQSPKQCIIRHLLNTKLYSIEFLRTEMMSQPSNYDIEYSPDAHNPYFSSGDLTSFLPSKTQYSTLLCSSSVY